MRQVAQPLRGFLAVELKHFCYRALFPVRQCVGNTLIYSGNAENVRVFFPQVRTYWTITPSFDSIVKQDIVGPSYVPSLAIIDELLKLHRSHLANFLQDERCGVENVGHDPLPRP